MHYYRHFNDDEFLEDIWPFLEKSVDFVLSGQTLEGDVLWAKDKNDKWMDDSLVTGCSSIYKSLRDFEQISKILGKKNISIAKELEALKKHLDLNPNDLIGLGIANRDIVWTGITQFFAAFMMLMNQRKL